LRRHAGPRCAYVAVVSLLTVLWPIFYAGTVPFILAFLALMMVGIAIAMRIGTPRHFDASWFTQLWGMTLALVIMLSAGTLCMVLILLMHRAGGPILKVLADISRYLGRPDYGDGLLDGFRRECGAFVCEGDHLILLTHSLGTVIAIDALLAHPEIVRRASRPHHDGLTAPTAILAILS